MIVGPLPPPVGGVETVTKALLESHAFREFEVRHCDTTKGRSKQTQGKFDLGNMWWAMIHFRRMLSNATSFKPDAVYMPVTATWSGFWRDAVLALIGRRVGAKIVGHVHGAWFDRILARKGLTGKLVRVCISQYDTLLMLGTPWKRLIESYGYRGNVFIVSPTVSWKCYEEGKTFVRRYENSFGKGLFVGQVGARKGVFELLEALQCLKVAGKKALMTIVGPPEFKGEWDTVMTCWKKLGLQDIVRFTGPLEGETLYREFRDNDYLVLPSHSEGLPIVMLEAGMFGLPVVATPVGAVTDVLEHERNALIVQPGDAKGLAEAIERVVKDAELRKRLGCELRRDVDRYQPDAICNRIAVAIVKTIEAKRV
ncbi:MAG: glycosyltransferase family 4 protein [Sulfuricaulis sp.]|uniref:glycosyltransferase family 4 protein n=1 Tax=Sulfuricaulis sp. TaxID=2003553 RepID=UPI0034A2D3C7